MMSEVMTGVELLAKKTPAVTDRLGYAAPSEAKGRLVVLEGIEHVSDWATSSFLIGAILLAAWVREFIVIGDGRFAAVYYFLGIVLAFSMTELLTVPSGFFEPHASLHHHLGFWTGACLAWAAPILALAVGAALRRVGLLALIFGALAALFTGFMLSIVLAFD
jgi:hypothetical protein